MRFNFNQSQLFIASLTSKLVELDFRFVFGWQLLRVNKKNGESETDGSRSDPDRRTSDWTATARTDTNGRRLSALLLEMIKPERKGTEQKGKGKETQSTNAKRIVSTIDSFSFFFCTFKSLVLEFPNWFQIHYLSIHLTREDGFKRKTLVQHPENCILLDPIPVKMTISENWVELNTTGKSVAHPTTPDIKKTPQNRPKMYEKVRVYNNRCNYLLRLICLFFFKKG